MAEMAEMEQLQNCVAPAQAIGMLNAAVCCGHVFDVCGAGAYYHPLLAQGVVQGAGLVGLRDPENPHHAK